MADVRNFKPQLSSSRMFKYVKGESKDFDDKKVDDKFYNYMTSSYETQDYLNDGYQFALTAPLIYQLDLLKEDIDDIHSHLSESKFTSKVQKFPVVDVTEEFFVSGLTQLKGNTRIDGHTDIRGDFKVNGSTISNLKPSLEFSDSLRTKTLISSSAQMASNISGSFTSLSASIATDINNAGGGTIDTSLTNGSTNAVTNNAVFDGLALKLALAGGVMTGDIKMINSVVRPHSVSATSITNNAIDMRRASIFQIKQKSGNWSLTTATANSTGQEITIIGLTTGVIRHSAKGAAFTFMFANGSNLLVSAGQAYKFVLDTNNIWRQIH